MSKAIIFEENTLWGLKSSTGEVLLRPEFLEISPCYPNVYLSESHEFAIYYIVLVNTGSNGNKYSLYDNKGTLILPPIYNNLCHAFGNYFIVSPEWGTGVYELRNGEIIPTDYENITFSKEYFIVKSDGKLGCFNKHGKNVCDLLFDEIKITEELIIGKDGGNVIIYQHNGKVVFNSFYDEITDYVYGKWSEFYIVKRNGFYGCLNSSPWHCETLNDATLLKEIIPCAFDYIAFTDKTIFNAITKDKDLFIKYFVKKTGDVLTFFLYDLYDVNDNPLLRNQQLLSAIVTDTFRITQPF